MSEKYLIIFSDGNFGFNDEQINGATSHLISEEEYENFFNLQGQGKQFRLKATSTGTKLSDYIEEYTPTPIISTNPLKEDTTKIIENLQNQIASLKETITSQNDTMETQGKIVNELVLAKLKTM